MLEASFVLAIALEIFLWTRTLWLWRRVYSLVTASILVLVTALYISERPGPIGVMLGVIGLFRLLNLFRLYFGRMHEVYLRRVTLRTSITLCTTQVLLIIVASVVRSNNWHITFIAIIQLLALIQAIVASVLLLVTTRNILKTRHYSNAVHYADKDLPTVTVAIPARNETDDLEACLTSLLATDYPKLEIVVLDDCSQNKRTPEIIRNFANQGVRFIQGTEPARHWLAKNHAYDLLAQHATGEYILFCGVDVRFGTAAIREIVTTALSRKKQMVCVLPKRLHGGITNAFIQPMRYWWELSLPRKLFNRPPVLSTCWLISRQALTKAGGFKAASRAVVPEAHFAKRLILRNEYRFTRSSELLEIYTVKKQQDQYDTAIRMRYPQLHRRPELVLVLLANETLFLLGPFVLLIAGFFSNIGSAHILAFIAVIMLTVVHEIIITVTSPGNWWIGIVNFPLAVLTELYVTLVSLWKYEFATVTWKERNICIPVMHVVPYLSEKTK